MINFSRMRFLVVDDFSEFRSSIRGILGLLAVQQIDTAANGEEVLELCRRHRYDVILHDYNLGDGLSGQQVLERLHAEKLLSPHCIFIMVTAENTQAMVLAALECEPDDYLSKPFSKAVLQTRLERQVRRKQVLAPVLTALEKGDSRQVLHGCQRIEEHNPRHAVLCQRYKADALYELGRFAELEQLLEQQVRVRPANWNLQRLSRLWLLQGQDDKLGFLLDAAMKQFPLMPELHDMRAEQAARRHELAAVVQALQAAVALSPNRVNRQIALARQAWLAGQRDVAVQALRQCWELGRHSIAFDAELLWQLVSILLKDSTGRDAEEGDGWLKILEKKDMQTARLQPLAALLRLLQQQARGEAPGEDELVTVSAQLLHQLSGYTAVTLLQLGDGLLLLGQKQAAIDCWQYCGKRHSAVAGVPEQLATRLPDHAAAIAQQQVARGRKAVALHLTGQLEAAAEAFAEALQETPAQIELNMAAARLYAARANAGDGQAPEQLQACLQRIGQLSPLEPDALAFSRMSNPLGAPSW